MHMRLLIVDGLEAHRIILTEILKKHPHIDLIDTAKNEREMIDKLKDSVFDGVIFDLDTERVNRPNPDLDGLLRQHHIEVPLILMAATIPAAMPQFRGIIDIIPKMELYQPGRLDQALAKLVELICK